MKYKKCIVSVSYFVVCFAKAYAKYLWNAKYESCIAGLIFILFVRQFFSHFMFRRRSPNWTGIFCMIREVVNILQIVYTDWYVVVSYFLSNFSQFPFSRWFAHSVNRHYEESVNFHGCFINILQFQCCPKMKQIISQNTLQSSNNVHTSRSKLCGIGTYRTLSRAQLHFRPCYWSIFLNVYLKDFFFILAKKGQWKE